MDNKIFSSELEDVKVGINFISHEKFKSKEDLMAKKIMIMKST